MYRAIKIIPKGKVKNPEKMTKEINILRDLVTFFVFINFFLQDHPNIIKLYETFEDIRNIYLVMELCEGGELFDRIAEEGSFSE